MTYLLDTNVLSETLRSTPDQRVLDWLDEVAVEALHVSVLTLGEIRRGAELLPQGAKRERIRAWLDINLPDWLGDRVLAVTADVADRWGRLRAQSPKTLPLVDSLLAATAIHHDLRLVTRNERDFKRFPGLEVVNPWRMD